MKKYQYIIVLRPCEGHAVPPHVDGVTRRATMTRSKVSDRYFRTLAEALGAARADGARRPCCEYKVYHVTRIA